jgi:hypothetical protein
MEVGAFDRGATPGATGPPPRIAEELLPLRLVPARQPRSRRVFVAVAILAAIAACGVAVWLIHSRLAVPADAGDLRAMEDARYAATAVETFALENGGSYTGAGDATLADFATSLSDQVEVSAGPTSYLITVHPGGTEREFTVFRGPDGATTLGCRPAGSGACPTTGTWE